MPLLTSRSPLMALAFNSMSNAHPHSFIALFQLWNLICEISADRSHLLAAPNMERNEDLTYLYRASPFPPHFGDRGSIPCRTRILHDPRLGRCCVPGKAYTNGRQPSTCMYQWDTLKSTRIRNLKSGEIKCARNCYLLFITAIKL